MLLGFNMRSMTRQEAGLNMARTAFICICVGVGAISFANDANQLLLKPIERMMAKLDTIKDNPMQAMRLGDVEFKRQQLLNSQRKNQIKHGNKLRKCWHYFKQKNQIQEPMETVILERTIIKLGGLLALCFGEEGGEIIGKYVGRESELGTISGHRVDAIIAFCQIHRFEHVTTILGDQSLLYVNELAEIVHLITDEYSGAANRNMGDSFLLAWRYTKEMLYSDKDKRKKLGDMAIMACVRIVAAIQKSPELARYRVHEGLSTDGRKDFKVEVGLGLHTGWAIEGAIGSDFKIDASYVSPNVKIADRLQSATFHYGTPIILSDMVIAGCTPEMALCCRMIDQVNSKTFTRPLRLYTIDLHTPSLAVESKPQIPVVKNRFKWRQARDIQKADKWQTTFKVWEQFRNDVDIVTMRAPYTTEFFKRFFTAYRNYEAGEWMVARDLFFTCHFEPKYHTPPVDLDEEDWPLDGPTRALLHFMQEHDFVSPPDWSGWRKLRYRGSQLGELSRVEPEVLLS